ncbi:hypothetical protein U2F10_03035 [Leptothoe sp. EHU-05/26/07-4]
MAEAKAVKVIFGEGYAGNIRVMIGPEEIPNIRSVKLPEVKPGELPEIEIKMLAPKLTVEDKTQDSVVEMEEVDLDLKPEASEVKVVDVRSTPPDVVKRSSSRKSAK